MGTDHTSQKVKNCMVDSSRKDIVSVCFASSAIKHYSVVQARGGAEQCVVGRVAKFQT